MHDLLQFAMQHQLFSNYSPDPAFSGEIPFNQAWEHPDFASGVSILLRKENSRITNDLKRPAIGYSKFPKHNFIQNRKTCRALVFLLRIGCPVLAC
jgi:hypothetical protein